MEPIIAFMNSLKVDTPRLNGKKGLFVNRYNWKKYQLYEYLCSRICRPPYCEILSLHSGILRPGMNKGCMHPPIVYRQPTPWHCVSAKCYICVPTSIVLLMITSLYIYNKVIYLDAYDRRIINTKMRDRFLLITSCAGNFVRVE